MAMTGLDRHSSGQPPVAHHRPRGRSRQSGADERQRSNEPFEPRHRRLRYPCVLIQSRDRRDVASTSDRRKRRSLSTPGPARLALLDERARPLLVVVAQHDAFAGRPCQRSRIALDEFVGPASDIQAFANRQLCIAGDAPGQRDRLRTTHPEGTIRLTSPCCSARRASSGSPVITSSSARLRGRARGSR
jgi:hypothetical protein